MNQDMELASRFVEFDLLPTVRICELDRPKEWRCCNHFLVKCFLTLPNVRKKRLFLFNNLTERTYKYQIFNIKLFRRL